MKQIISQKDVMNVLDNLYGKSINGIPQITKPIVEVADEYIHKYQDKDVAAQKFVAAQTRKCTVSGFLTGLGGVIVLPVAIGADLTATWYVQMRMIAGLAHIGGYDVTDDEVQSLVYACLAGVSVNNVAKKAGIEFGEKAAANAIKKIPGELITKINQKVGYRFLTKFGQKGTINLVDLIPGVGGFVGGGFNYAETKMISSRGYRGFVKGNMSAFGNSNKYWFDFSGNSEDLIYTIEKTANKLGFRTELEYHQGDPFVYVYATEDELDILIEQLPAEISYREVTRGEAKMINKRFKKSKHDNFVDVDYDVVESEE